MQAFGGTGDNDEWDAGCGTVYAHCGSVTNALFLDNEDRDASPLPTLLMDEGVELGRVITTNVQLKHLESLWHRRSKQPRGRRQELCSCTQVEYRQHAQRSCSFDQETKNSFYP